MSRRTLWALLAVVALAPVLTGCGETADNPGSVTLVYQNDIQKGNVQMHSMVLVPTGRSINGTENDVIKTNITVTLASLEHPTVYKVTIQDCSYRGSSCNGYFVDQQEAVPGGATQPVTESFPHAEYARDSNTGLIRITTQQLVSGDVLTSTVVDLYVP